MTAQSCSEVDRQRTGGSKKRREFDLSGRFLLPLGSVDVRHDALEEHPGDSINEIVVPIWDHDTEDVFAAKAVPQVVTRDFCVLDHLIQLLGSFLESWVKTAPVVDHSVHPLLAFLWGFARADEGELREFGVTHEVDVDLKL